MYFRRFHSVLLFLAMICLMTPSHAEQLLFSSALEEIADEAFSGCEQIREAIFPDGIKTIGERAFQNCTKLRQVRLPASIETIGDQAFDGCAEALYFLCQPGTPGADWATASGFDWDAGTVCRALIIGQNYSGTDYALQGPACDMHAVASCLRQMHTRSYTITEKTNLTAEGILSEIGSAFGAASSNDISMLYYSGHGADGGYLVGQDLETISPAALRSALDQIPGRIDSLWKKTIGFPIGPNAEP